MYTSTNNVDPDAHLAPNAQEISEASGTLLWLNNLTTLKDINKAFSVLKRCFLENSSIQYSPLDISPAEFATQILLGVAIGSSDHLLVKPALEALTSSQDNLCSSEKNTSIAPHEVAALVAYNRIGPPQNDETGPTHSHKDLARVILKFVEDSKSTLLPYIRSYFKNVGILADGPESIGTEGPPEQLHFWMETTNLRALNIDNNDDKSWGNDPTKWNNLWLKRPFLVENIVVGLSNFPRLTIKSLQFLTDFEISFLNRLSQKNNRTELLSQYKEQAILGVCGKRLRELKDESGFNPLGFQDQKYQAFFVELVSTAQSSIQSHLHDLLKPDGGLDAKIPEPPAEVTLNATTPRVMTKAAGRV